MSASKRRRPSAEPSSGSAGPLGVRHEADDVALLVADAGDGAGAAVDVGRVVEAAVLRRVAEDDAALALEPLQLVVGKVEVPLAVGDRHREHLADRRGPR